MMHDGIDGLLHLGDLATGTLPAGVSSENDTCVIAQSTLAEADMISIKQLPPAAVQGWCLARIAEHRDHIRLLRELYDPAACTTIWKTKSHIRALRSKYNAFAPINHLLPPEVLIEVFSNLDPEDAVYFYSRRFPVMHICRYWRMLVFKTPQFWASLFTLTGWYAPKFKFRIDLFMAALPLSAPVDLTISIPFRSLDVVDITVPHANRIAFLKIEDIPNNKFGTQRLLEQHMPRLKEVIIFNDSLPRDWRFPPLNLYFNRYPNIQSLRVELTLSYFLVAPYTSLRELRLLCCTMHVYPLPTSAGYDGRSRCSVHSALELFPNLEKIYLIRTLSREFYFEGTPEFTKTVHLPRLRRLEIDDEDIYISPFISHLAFPSTATLVLKPVNRFPFTLF